jgi:hypothetical protein
LPDFTRAGELTDSSVSEAYSSITHARKTWNGENFGSRSSGKPKKIEWIMGRGFYLGARRTEPAPEVKRREILSRKKVQLL